MVNEINYFTSKIYFKINFIKVNIKLILNITKKLIKNN